MFLMCRRICNNVSDQKMTRRHRSQAALFLPSNGAVRSKYTGVHNDLLTLNQLILVTKPASKPQSPGL